MLGFNAIATMPIADDGERVATIRRLAGAVLRGGQRLFSALGGGALITASSRGGSRIRVN